MFYIGWSQGNIQMFYALAHLEESFFVDNLYKLIAFAPCFVNPPWTDESYYEQSLYKLNSIGVYDEYGPNWEEEHKRICDELGEIGCDYLSCTNCQPMSV